MVRPGAFLVVVLGLVGLPRLAAAEPAVVRVFEAEVHAAPDPSSPVVYVFAESSRLSVSEAATNGFRKVRLPDGAVGYVREAALSFGARAPVAEPTTPPPPPPSAPPPPPVYRGPPYPPPRYRPVVFAPERHTGFYLHFDAGLGYQHSGTSAADGDLSTAGAAGSFGFAFGGAIAENLILSAYLWDTFTVAPVKSGSRVVSTSDITSSLVGVGPSLTYYFMPQNVFVSVTPSVTTLVLSDYGYYGYASETDTGFGGRVALGKEWWTGPRWGIGLVAQFSFGVASTWSTYGGSLGMSMSFD